MIKTLVLTVTFDKDHTRLDDFLHGAGLDLSKRKIKLIIDQGGVSVNQRRAFVASHSVRRGDKVRIQYQEESLKKTKDSPPLLQDRDILLDRDDVIALNKPAGLPSQATKDPSLVHVIPSLETYLRGRQDHRGPLVLVHRLDKETTGVLLVAVGNVRATWLTEQFRKRTVKKTYYALCHGIPRRDQFTEDCPLTEIDRKTGNVRAVRSGGRPAITHFKVLATHPKYKVCLVECRPETGRSHQIRVHLDINGLPIVGDKRYGSGKNRDLPTSWADLAAAHHLLHARAIQLALTEGGAPVRIEAPLPPGFASLLELAQLKWPPVEET